MGRENPSEIYVMELPEIVEEIAAILKVIDGSRVQCKNFQPGLGPWGEPQLIKMVVGYLNDIPTIQGKAHTKRTPDLLISGEWALEFKLARPFGDNGREAENWSVNLLHPYPGNVSAIGDCYKLLDYEGTERKAIVVIGYEHNPPIIHLDPLVDSFEEIARHVCHFSLSKRIEEKRDGLIHPVHQVVRLFAWELYS